MIEIEKIYKNQRIHDVKDPENDCYSDYDFVVGAQLFISFDESYLHTYKVEEKTVELSEHESAEEYPFSNSNKKDPVQYSDC